MEGKEGGEGEAGGKKKTAWAAEGTLGEHAQRVYGILRVSATSKTCLS